MTLRVGSKRTEGRERVPPHELGLKVTRISRGVRWWCGSPCRLRPQRGNALEKTCVRTVDTVFVIDIGGIVAPGIADPDIPELVGMAQGARIVVVGTDRAGAAILGSRRR